MAFAFCFLTGAVSSSVYAQEKKTDPEKAFVRVLNASTVLLKEPWRSGVDLAFKDGKLAMDVRAGEAAPYHQISFTGKDALEARATGRPAVVGSVPAKFEKNGFYSIYFVGAVNEGGFEVSPLVIQDFPIPAGKMRKGFARMGIFNAVSIFPVKLQIGSGNAIVLPPVTFAEIYLEPGSHPYSLKFPHKSSEGNMQGLFIVKADSEYSVVVIVSPEKPDRPSVRFFDNSTAKADAEEAAKAAEEEKKKQGASTPS